MAEMIAEQPFDRLPPHDIEIEQCVLGAAMLSPDAAGQVVERLREGDFLRPAHQTVFAAMAGLYGKGEPVNPLTVRVELQRHRDGKKHVPDGVYLHELMERVPVVNSVGANIAALLKLSELRGMAYAGPRITELAYHTPVEDAAVAVEQAHKILDEATRVAQSATARSVAELVTPFMESLEAGGDERGVTTGWVDLDSLLFRLRPGQLITIGARPGMGKTAAMCGMAHHVGVKLGLPVFVATLEMSAQEYMTRLVALDAKVTLRALMEPSLLTDGDWERLAVSNARLSEATTLFIDDKPGMGIGHIRAALRSMRRSGSPAALAIVDYLQLMQTGGKVESRQVEVSQFSRSLKILAKEFDTPIVIGSQLNREVERRQEKRPMLSDLRESGSVEQDSDVVILLYRPDAYDQESPRSGEIDFIVDKNRNGPKATITEAFQGHYSRIVDMAKPEWTPHGVVS